MQETTILYFVYIILSIYCLVYNDTKNVDLSFNPTSFRTAIHLKTQGAHAFAPRSNAFHHPLHISHPPTKGIHFIN